MNLHSVSVVCSRGMKVTQPKTFMQIRSAATHTKKRGVNRSEKV